MLPQTPPPLQRSDGRTGPAASPAALSAPSSAFSHAAPTTTPSHRRGAPVAGPPRTAPLHSRYNASGPTSSAVLSPSAAAVGSAHTPQPTTSAADCSLLSTHSTVASRIEVRDVAALVRQLAESRCAARQLQQHMQQLETSTTRSESRMEASEQGGAGEEQREGVAPLAPPTAAAPTAQGSSAPQTPSPSSPPAADRQQHHTAPSPSSHTRPSSAKKRAVTVERKHRGASVASADTASEADERSGASSVLSTSLLTSTSTFVSTSSTASLKETPQRRRASSARRSRRQPSASRGEASRAKARGAHRSRRSRGEFREGSSSHHHAQRRRRGASYAASPAEAHSYRNSPTQPPSSPSIRHSSREARRDAKTRKSHRSTVDSTPALHAASKMTHRSRHHRHHHHRHASRERVLTSLDERRAHAQEARELRRARRWQRRYYDLMSSYTESTAQREAELADIHDLIEYMSWEQDRARRPHLTPTSAAAAAAITSGEESVVGDGARGAAAAVDDAHQMTRRTRGTSPLPVSRAASPSSVPQHTPAPAASPSGTRDQQVLERASTPPHRTPLSFSADNTPPLTDRREEGNAVGDSDGGWRGPSNLAERDAQVQRGAVLTQLLQDLPAAPAADVPVPAAAVSQKVLTAVHAVESLQEEADAWRLRCLALLQQQQSSRPSPPLHDGAGRCDTADSSQLSHHAVPPPLPPRPAQRWPDSGVERAMREAVHSGAGIASAVTNDNAVTERTHGEPLRDGREGSYAATTASSRLQDGAISTLASAPAASASRPFALFRFGVTTCHKGEAQPAAPTLHRYAPPPPPPPPSAHQQQRHPSFSQPTRSAAPAPHHDAGASPLRPPLFVALPDYRPANPHDFNVPQGWCTAAPPTAEQPTQQQPQQHYPFHEGDGRAWAETPGGAYYSAYRGEGPHVVGSRATSWVSGDPPQASQLNYPSNPPPPPSTTATAHPSHTPDLFQAPPPPPPNASPGPAAAVVAVAREQLERDIRRHDQLLAAIGKLQKTAAAHASRSCA